MDKPDIELVKTGKTFKRKNKPGAGRPSKLNQEIIDKLVNYLRMGVYLETALSLVDIDRETFKTWCRKGREKKRSIHGKFLGAIDKALAEADVRDLSVIDKTSQGIDAEYLTYPKGTLDEFGNDVSGQLVFEETRYGKRPILKRPGVSPNWQAAAWKLQQRKPLHFTVKGADRVPLENQVTEGEDKFEIVFIEADHGKS